MSKTGNQYKSEHPLMKKGLLFSYDERDEQNKMYATSPKIDDTIRHSWKIGPALNQGDTSHCVGYAWAHFLMSEPWNIAIDVKKQPSEFYRLAQKEDEWPGEEPQYYGTSVRAGAKVLAKEGQIARYVWGYSVEDIAKFISENGPVVVGTKWYYNMSMPDHNGFVSPTSSYEGGHAWLVYGVDTKWEMFMGLNSWGNSYGRNGRFFVRFKDMETLLKDGGVACSALKV